MYIYTEQLLCITHHSTKRLCLSVVLAGVRTEIMVFKVVALLVMVAITMAVPDGYGGPVYPSVPLPYNFGYSVKGDYKGPNFGQNEKSDGKAVYGSYSVALPDGRIQHVDYTADHYNGFVAKVSYKGKAQHPSYYGPAIVFPQNGGGYH